MNLLDRLSERWRGIEYPFFIHNGESLKFKDLSEQKCVDLSRVQSGDVVALIGDFNPRAILTFLQLVDKDIILVPLTSATRSQHNYFFDSALVDVVIEGDDVSRLDHGLKHELIDSLRSRQHAGLVLFSSGTTGRPKAILHDLTLFLRRFETPRPTLKTLSFLLFDHIGGLNTLLHTLFNGGTVVAPKSRDVKEILSTCAEHSIELLPATPTFLRMMLMSGLIPDAVPESLRVITYGTERMDQPTLDALCELLPKIDFRQTFGMSELGIVRVKSEARNSLFMKIGGEGIETRVRKNLLEIRAETRMLGYLNALSPFDKDGWYKTNDVVEERDGYFKVVGRASEVINVGGLKFMAADVEEVALRFPCVELAKAEAKSNPVTGEHVELTVSPAAGSEVDPVGLKKFLAARLPNHMIPRRIRVANVNVGHRFKKV